MFHRKSSDPDSRSTVCSGKPRRPSQILLAEDNLVNQKLAQRVMEKLGHAITVVETGTQAVVAASRGHFDLILMDVQMPEMDGLEATRSIREAERKPADEGRPRRRIPIVAMTAHAMSGDRDLCLAAGMDGYISKPINLQTLVETIERVPHWREAAPSPNKY